MSNQTRLILSIVILFLAALVLVLPTGVRTALEHNLWSMAAAEAAFGDGQAPPPRPDPHPHAYQWLARLALQDKDPEAAIGWLSQLGEGSEPFAMNAKAQAYYQDGQFQAAFDLWQEIGYSSRLSAAGRAAQDEGNHELATLAYRAAFEVDPVAYTLAFSSALRRIEQQIDAEAVLIDSLETHLSADQRTTWWRALGDLYYDEGDWQKAEVAYRAALSEDIADQATWVRLGWLIYNESGDAETAMEYFNEAIRAEPERGMGYYAVGRLLVREEQPEQALVWFQKASENEPQSLNNLLVYANLLRDTGQFELAFFEYEKAINGWPDSWYPYYHVSWAYLLNGQSDLAFQAIEKSIELNPDNIGTHLRAGEIYEAFGEVDLALAAYQAVLAIDPEYAVALRAVERLTGGE